MIRRGLGTRELRVLRVERDDEAVAVGQAVRRRVVEDLVADHRFVPLLEHDVADPHHEARASR